MMPVRIALSVTIIALAGAVWAQSAAEGLFAEANQLYRAGAYEAAREKYQEVVEAGYVDARLFYNLGNACFKSDRLGEGHRLVRASADPQPSRRGHQGQSAVCRAPDQRSRSDYGWQSGMAISDATVRSAQRE